jgi:hypothetical protein
MSPRRAPPLALGALLLASCAPEPEAPAAPGDGVYVGHVAGSDALVAVVARGGAVVAYTCGGPASLATHTGWFHPVDDPAGASATIPRARSAGGLELTGAFTTTAASGTLRLRDGRTTAWRAERADPRTGAGFFTRGNGGELAGLIVANDGAMAGDRVATDGDGARASAPITAPRPAPSAPSVTGSVTVQSQRTAFTLVRTVDPAPLQVQRRGPVIIVLLHGVTSLGDEPAPDGGPMALDLDLSARNGEPIRRPFPGSRLHARVYWSSQFLSGLLTGRADSPLFTLNGVDITGDRFLDPDTAQDRPNTDNPGSPIPRSTDCDLHDFVVAESPPAAPTRPGARPSAPQLSVLLAHRDGKVDYTRQLSYSADQLYACVSRFEEHYGVTPGLVFVGHSGGGLVTRGILSNPPRAAFLAVEAPGILRVENGHYDRQNVDGNPLSVRDEMAFLRDRALYAVTLATPHDGSSFADWGAAQRTRVAGIRRWLAAGAAADLTPFGLDESGVAFVRSVSSALALPAPPSSPERAEETTRRLSRELLRVLDDFVQRNYDGTPITAQLRRDFWRAMNRVPLDPTTARRGVASPIPGAGGALVPIYAAGARSPGSDALDTLDPAALVGGFQRVGALQTPFKAAFWIAATTFTDALLRLSDGAPRPPAALADRLDRVRVTTWLPEVQGMLARRSFVLDATFRATFLLSGADARSDLIDWLSNESGTRLNQVTLIPPISLPRQWELVDRPVSFRIPALRCSPSGAAPIDLAIDLPGALEAMVRAFGSMDAALRALASLDFPALLARFDSAGGALREAIPALRDRFEPLIRVATNPQCLDPARWSLVAVTREVRLPLPTEAQEPARDGFVDHDGFVTYDSALALALGRDGVGGAPLVPEFFDHTHLDDVVGGQRAPGAFYRRYDSALEPFNHEIQRVEVARWVRALVARDPGPLPAIAGDLSVHPTR